MKKLLLFLAICGAGLAQSVSQTFQQSGSSGVYVVVFNWTAGTSGAVPTTQAILNMPSNGSPVSVAGYRIISAETVPGSPAPTNGYNVTLPDQAGVDLLAGGGDSQSSSSPAAIVASPTAPPLIGGFSLTIAGNAVSGAKGTVYVYIAPITQVLGLSPTNPSFPAQGQDLFYAAPCGSGGSPGFRAPCSSDALVYSFNGRQGAVVPATNDYTYSQIGGSVQGNTTKPQMAGVNSNTQGALLCDDTNGNATTSSCSTPVVTSLYGNVATFQWSQSPSGSLTSTDQATVTLTPCPAGVNGSDSAHYLLVAGTGTPESVLITGGSCTSNAASGTVIFTPANSHGAGFSIGTATAGIQEAANVGCAAGSPFTISITSTLTVYATPTITCNSVTVRGYGNTILVSANGQSNVYGLYIQGSQSTTTASSSTSKALNARSTTGNVNSLNVGSATGFSAGNYVLIEYNDGTYVFDEISLLNALSGDTLTFSDPIVIPVQSTLSNNVIKLSPLSNIVVEDLKFDCSSSVSSGAALILGLRVDYTVDSTFQNITANNCYNGSLTNGSGGMWFTYSYHDDFTNLRAYNSGNEVYNAIGWFGGTDLNVMDVSSIANPNQANYGFGIGIGYTVLSNFANLVSEGNNERQIKLAGAGWNNLTNLIANNSTNATGLAVTIGSYRNNIYGLKALNNSGSGNGEGIWMNGQDNEYNNFRDVVALGNATADIFWSTSDINNTFYGVTLGTYPSGTSTGTQTDNGSGNRIELTGLPISLASVACTGTASSSTTLTIQTTPPTTCTVTSASYAQSAIAVPTNGIVRNLRVVAGTGGVNSSSGVVTISGTGITCTLGTGTTCNDTTHYYPVAAGNDIYVQVTTQAMETLANLQISFEY